MAKSVGNKKSGASPKINTNKQTSGKTVRRDSRSGKFSMEIPPKPKGKPDLKKK